MSTTAEENQSDKKTPNKDAFFQRLNEVKTRCGALGVVYIRGIDSDEDDDPIPQDQDFTVEQISGLRCILVNDKMEKEVKKAKDFITQGQSGSGIMMFNTHSGNMVILGIPDELRKISKRKQISDKFNALLALTYMLNSYDYWVNDNEFWGPGEELDLALKKLGTAWKKMLEKSDDELGIDGEFTRPGVVALLEDFGETVASTDHTLSWH